MSDFFAMRGGRALSRGEYRAHLALATRLENVGVFLGAGASVESGGLTMEALWESFSNKHAASVDWLHENGFLPEAEEVTEQAEDTRENVQNIESLLERLRTAESEWGRQGQQEPLKQLQQHMGNLYREVLEAALLDRELFANPSSIVDAPCLRLHRHLLKRLIATRQPGQTPPWLFTTNYDLAIEWAAESLGVRLIDGFAGLHRRAFSASNFDLAFRNVQARGEARFGVYHIYLVKLHGSLSWAGNENDAVHEVSSTAAWQYLRRYLENQTSEDWPGIVVFPETSKYVATSTFTYGELVRRFTEFLGRPHTCLIINGYGFTDEHINRILLSGLQNPTLHLILYIPFLALPTAVGQSCTVPESKRWLGRLINAQMPQVTIVGTEEEAHFDRMVEHFPEPALIEDWTAKQLKLARLLSEASLPGEEADSEETEEDGGE